MTFLRTARGLANLHVFFRVDLIVFVEGGVGLPLESIVAGEDCGDSYDLAFWRQFVKIVLPSRKCCVRPVGSKQNALKIAVLIKGEELKTAAVALDLDYDDLLGTYIDEPFIWYTLGYSWENDVWSLEILMAVIEKLVARDLEPNLEAELRTRVIKFWRDVYWAVRGDVLLVGNDMNVIPRQGVGRLLESDESGWPRVKRGELRKGVRLARNQADSTASQAPKDRIVTEDRCYGHLVGQFFCALARAVLRRNGVKVVPNHFLVLQAVREFWRKAGSDRGDRYHLHYFQHLAGRIAALRK